MRKKVFLRLQKYLSHFDISDTQIYNAVSQPSTHMRPSDFDWAVYNQLLRELLSEPISEEMLRATASVYYRMAMVLKLQKKDASHIIEQGDDLNEQADRLHRKKCDDQIRKLGF